jgi:hypothetical protein
VSSFLDGRSVAIKETPNGADRKYLFAAHASGALQVLDTIRNRGRCFIEALRHLSTGCSLLGERLALDIWLPTTTVVLNLFADDR